MKSYDQLTLDLSAGLKLLVANLCLFGKLELGIWSLFVICYMVLVILLNLTTPPSLQYPARYFKPAIDVFL